MNKNEQRKLIKQNLSLLTPQQIIEKSESICDKLIGVLQKEEYKVVMSYLPLQKEVDLSKANEWMKQNGIEVCFPKTELDDMTAYCSDEFEIGNFGILEPVNGTEIPLEKIDLIIMPCVGFDSKKNRLGHGKGYYDRYIGNKKIKTILVGFEQQRLAEIVTNEFDVAADLAISDLKIYE